MGGTVRLERCDKTGVTNRGAWSFYPIRRPEGLHADRADPGYGDLRARGRHSLGLFFVCAARMAERSESKAGPDFPVGRSAQTPTGRMRSNAHQVHGFNVHPLFAGQANSIVFVTTHSVKAISQGVPVVARYTYDPNIKGAFLFRTSAGPLSSGIHREVSRRAVFRQKTRLKFAPTALIFRNSFWPMQARSQRSLSQSWESRDQLPVEVLLRWRGKDSVVHARVCMVNALFTIEVQKKTGPGRRRGWRQHWLKLVSIRKVSFSGPGGRLGRSRGSHSNLRRRRRQDLYAPRGGTGVRLRASP